DPPGRTAAPALLAAPAAGPRRAREDVRDPDEAVHLIRRPAGGGAAEDHREPPRSHVVGADAEPVRAQDEEGAGEADGLAEVAGEGVGVRRVPGQEDEL